MNDYTYLVPANSKRQALIFGFFMPVDLIIFGVGIVLTFLVASIIPATTVGAVVIILIPILVSGFLIFPIPNYHNTRVLIKEIYMFLFKTRRRYVWRGWCYKYEQSDSE